MIYMTKMTGLSTLPEVMSLVMSAGVEWEPLMPVRQESLDPLPCSALDAMNCYLRLERSL